MFYGSNCHHLYLHLLFPHQNAGWFYTLPRLSWEVAVKMTIMYLHSNGLINENPQELVHGSIVFTEMVLYICSLNITIIDEHLCSQICITVHVHMFYTACNRVGVLRQEKVSLPR